MSRYLRHDCRPPEKVKSVQCDLLNALIDNLELVQRHTPDRHTAPGGGVYVGTAGAAVMFHHLAVGIPRVSSSQCFSNGDQHLLTASADRFSSLHPGKASFLETYVGVATLVLIRALQTSHAQDSPESSTNSAFADQWRGASKTLQEVFNVIVRDSKQENTLDDGDCEVLYGRAGFLYAILRLRSALASETGSASDIASTISSLVSDSNIKQLVDTIILRGKRGAELHSAGVSDRDIPALMWSWHGKRYLGGAHGIAGILHILLLCPSKCIAQHMPAILQTVEWLITLQDQHGNWPTKAPKHSSRHRSHDGDELVHWCHGAPGFLILLSTLLRRAPSVGGDMQLSSALRDDIISSIERGAALVYSHGFLRKGVGLCHGVAGSIFALLAVSDTLPSNLDYFRQAIHLAHLATGYNELTRRGKMRTPDRKWSLYEGTAGMCCAWGEVLRRMEDGKAGGDVGCQALTIFKRKTECFFEWEV